MHMMDSLRVCCVYILVFIAILVETAPTCTYKIANEEQHICTNDNGTDYVLNRGLVSDNSRTIYVSLKDCRITDIESDALRNLNSLKFLDLSRNQIANLKVGTLEGFKRLIYLNLSYNILSDIETGLFDQIPNLDVLDLSGNSIGQLKSGVFGALEKLRDLNVSRNYLVGKKFSPYLFDSNKKIYNLDFSHNDMNETPENLLHALEKLQYLNLKNCLLKEVPTFVTKPNLVTLKELYLSGNQIDRIESATTFINLENLVRLDLADNSIETVHEDAFKPLKRLRVINLRGNKLPQIPETLFQNMRLLSNIDLSHNSIETVPVNAFRGTAARNLNLSKNRFTYLTDNFLLELRNSGVNVKKFYFNQNPWQCACLLQVVNEAKRLEVVYNSLQFDGNYPVCVTAKDLICKRQAEFNAVFTDMYDSKVPSNP